MPKKLKLYVVQMYRWGDEDLHSYIEGVYTNRSTARKHGRAEWNSRDHKYEFKIWVHPLNEPRMFKYMSDEEIHKRFARGKKKLLKKHPKWFDKNGNFK